MTTTATKEESAMDRQLEIKTITNMVAQTYTCFGRGTRMINNSPIERALMDRAPSFAAAVDVTSVVAFVLDAADKLRTLSDAMTTRVPGDRWMMELVFILALIVFSWRMRRAARRPQRIEIHHYFHFPGGDGERDEEPLLLDTPIGDNVIPLRRQNRRR
jgi:hypothetical protein